MATEQPILWEAEDFTELKPVESRPLSLGEQAEDFHAMNPQVYRLAVKIARFMKDRGVKRYGIGAIWEIMRFKYLETTGSIYKLNNNYRAWFARRMMRDESDLAGFFETREGPHDSEYGWRSEPR